MKIIVLCSTVLATLLLVTPLSSALPAQDNSDQCLVNNDTTQVSPDQVRVIGADPKSEIAKELLKTFEDLVLASNRHLLEDILKHYSPQFISGDNLTLAQIKDLILETWKAYPDICYVSKPIEIRIKGDWATIETVDRSVATAPPDKNIIDMSGRMVSESRSMQFFRRSGNSWEISSDSTIWEEAIIRYGIGDEVEIVLSAPEQVKAGELYSATIRTNIPDGTFTIATIDNQTLTYPHDKADDKFRALAGGEASELQRVLKANSANRNEIVTATLGMANVEQKNPERPSLSLNGIATIIKRVNVVPVSAEDVIDELKKKNLVKISADGKIDMSVNPQAIEEEPPSDLELVPSEEEEGNPEEEKEERGKDK